MTAKYKGSTLKTIKNLLKEKGPETEKRFLDRLRPETRRTFELALPNSWITIEEGAEIMDAAATMLFGGGSRALRMVARLNARQNLGGIYKVFLRIPSIEFVLKRLSNIWHTFFDTGEARVENFTGKQATLVVEKFPEYPEILRESVCGFIEQLLEMTGAKQVGVTRETSDPQAWRWRITWQ